MTRFTVAWSKDAQEALADFWIAASDRAAITKASARIDALLAQDPVSNGHPVSEGLYRLIVTLLVVLCTIDEDAHRVEVVSVGVVV